MLLILDSGNGFGTPWVCACCFVLLPADEIYGTVYGGGKSGSHGFVVLAEISS
jgi:hypothetical protein